MQNVLRTGVLLAGALSIAAAMSAQHPPAKRCAITQADVALTYSLEHSKVAAVNGNSFWMNGGALDGAVIFFHGLGVAANVTGEHAANVSPGVDFTKIAYMAGPRYTLGASKYNDRMLRNHATQIFGEALFGGAHALDGIFPSAAGVSPRADAFAMQIGGGIDIALAKGFGIRAIEADYVLTTLPNNAGNSQNDLRLAIGVSKRFP